MTETTNHGWDIPEVGGDEGVWGEILNNFFDEDLDTEISLKGPFAERPTAGEDIVNLYLATDRRIVYYNDGNSWEAVYGLGTEDNPVSGTSYFENLEASVLSFDESYQTRDDLPTDAEVGSVARVTEADNPMDEIVIAVSEEVNN